MVHKLRQVSWDKQDDKEFGFDWIIIANEIIKKLIIEKKHSELINYNSLSKGVQLAVPTPDHFFASALCARIKKG
jgi:4,5-DOPA dioxygenase extradiol